MSESSSTMDVTVRRSGGFAGITRVWSVTIDTDSDDAGSWRTLLDQVPWGTQRTDTDQADRYIYRLECNSLTATIPEGALTTSCRLVIERVQEASDTADSENGPPPEGDGPS